MSDHDLSGYLIMHDFDSDSDTSESGDTAWSSSPPRVGTPVSVAPLQQDHIIHPYEIGSDIAMISNPGDLMAKIGRLVGRYHKHMLILSGGWKSSTFAAQMDEDYYRIELIGDEDSAWRDLKSFSLTSKQIYGVVRDLVRRPKLASGPAENHLLLKSTGRHGITYATPKMMESCSFAGSVEYLTLHLVLEPTLRGLHGASLRLMHHNEPVGKILRWFPSLRMVEISVAESMGCWHSKPTALDISKLPQHEMVEYAGAIWYFIRQVRHWFKDHSPRDVQVKVKDGADALFGLGPLLLRRYATRRSLELVDEDTSVAGAGLARASDFEKNKATLRNAQFELNIIRSTAHGLVRKYEVTLRRENAAQDSESLRQLHDSLTELRKYMQSLGGLLDTYR